MILENDCLKIEFGRQDYSNVRFDQSGAVHHLWLKHADGDIPFCSAEFPEGGKGGIGFDSEFDMYIPIGYYEAKPGELFLKPGVGWLRRADQKPYFFMKDYELVFPGEFSETVTDDSITIEWNARVINGRGCVYTKTYTLRENQMIIDFAFKNTGSISYPLLEYTHNFLAINSLPNTGSNYNFSFICNEGLVPDNFFASRRKKVGYHAVMGEECNSINGWRLSCGGFYVSEKFDFLPAKVAVWTMQHVVSPETFFTSDCIPGSKIHWRRTYSFGAD